MVMNQSLQRKILWSLLLALGIYMLLILYADWRSLGSALNAFPWMLLPAILGLTLLNYLGRLIKWHWYLRLIDVEIDVIESGRIFGVGMLMVMTPAKLGEFLKSYMVRNRTATPMVITAPVILAERLTDGLAMLILAGVGLFAFPDSGARIVAMISLLGILSFIVLVQIRPLAMFLLDSAGRVPILARFVGPMAEFYDSSYRILRPRNLVISVGIGCVSWLCEGLAYGMVLTGFGLVPSLEMMLTALFIFSLSTVVGAVVATPGGLGGTEGSLVALSTQLFGLGLSSATAAALLIRFATLWFGVGLGALSLLLWPYLLDEFDGDIEHLEKRENDMYDHQPGVSPSHSAVLKKEK